MPYNPSVICCTKCDQHKPIDQFYGEMNFCKSCHSQYMKEWKTKQKIKNLLAEVLEAA